MKFDPNIPNLRHRSQTHVHCLLICALIGWFASIQSTAQAADKARLLATRTIERLVYGDAFDAKLRQRVWVGGREIIGVGQYEQAGGGTGRYIMELSMHDGDNKQSLRQLSDGRLTWTRTQIGAEIAIGRVDLGGSRNTNANSNCHLPINNVWPPPRTLTTPTPLALAAISQWWASRSQCQRVTRWAGSLS